MRASFLAGAVSLAACQLTASIGGAGLQGTDETGATTTASETSTGPAPLDDTGSTGIHPGPSTSSSSDTRGGNRSSSSGSSGTGGFGTAGDDPCGAFPSPMECFDNGCLWHFPLEQCRDPADTGGPGPPPACEPHMDDGPCVSCLRFGCCSALQACMNDPECTCFFNCVNADNDPLQCQGVCAPSEASGYLAMCAGDACFRACG